jgi:hypothetical protein
MAQCPEKKQQYVERFYKDSIAPPSQALVKDPFSGEYKDSELYRNL